MKDAIEKNSIIDIEVVNRPLTAKEKHAFSKFLKLRKEEKAKVKKFGKESTTAQQQT